VELHRAVPLLAALVATASGAVILALSPRERANRIGALLMGSVAWWAGCEVMWRQAADASAALLWHRAAAPGFVFLGAHAIWFLSALNARGLPRLARAVPVVYAANAVFLGLAWSGPLLLAGMERSGFGWILVPGPLLPVWFAWTAGVVAFGLVDWVRVNRRSGERADGLYATRVAVGVALATAVAGASDVGLAALGIEAMRVGSLAISVLGLAVIVLLGHLGLSRLNAAGLAQRIVRILPDGVALLRPSGRIRVANPSMREILGCGEGPLEGRILTDHLDLPVLDPGVEYRAQECELLQDSGFRIPVSVSTTPVQGPGTRADVLLILRDVREVTALRNRLATSERLAVVGQLAGGIAHEINNPLAFVRANLQHLQRESAELAAKTGDAAVSEDLRERVEEWEEVVAESLGGVERAMQIVRDVTTFSDAGGDTRRPIDLAEVIDQVLRVASLGLPPRVRLDGPGAAPEPLEVVGSAQRLKQLLLNLLVNAVQAVGDAGMVRVEARRDGGRVRVTVQDDGCGIPAEDLQRVFDPFFTTRPVGDGAGLGLAMCHEIARSHGGSIDVRSERGRGTRVDVTFPAQPSAG